ncbi:MAG: hypothetical protein GY862_08315, partial [Gammaproteobacteria bacterium]|nr:hypothetical protein [Gammaproteobacteria bacterium]
DDLAKQVDDLSRQLSEEKRNRDERRPTISEPDPEKDLPMVFGDFGDEETISLSSALMARTNTGLGLDNDGSRPDAIYVIEGYIDQDMESKSSKNFCLICNKPLKRADRVFRVMANGCPFSVIHQDCADNKRETASKFVSDMLSIIHERDSETNININGCIETKSGDASVYVLETENCWCNDGKCLPLPAPGSGAALDTGTR